MVRDIMDYITQIDPEVGESITCEFNRQRRNLELIASENIVSEAVLLAAANVLTNKYAEGYPAKRYYGGCECVDEVENIAIARACKIFGAAYANVQPHAGAPANTAVYFALLQPGDKVLGMNLNHGGHLTHGSPVNISGKYYNFIPYSVDDDTEMINYDKLRELALKERPKMIVAGASAYPRAIRFDLFADIAREAGAYLFVDMAHIAGLVAAGLHQSPIPYADVVTTTTHKTLRGPRGGMILARDAEFGKQFDKAVFPGTQGGPLMHIIAAKAICFGEALKPEFKTYQQQVINNAKKLASELAAQGCRLLSGGTDNHLMMVDLRNMSLTGKEMQIRLDDVYITVNKNTIPNDPQSPFVTSGVRIGTPAVTTRGMKEAEMEEIAGLIKLAAVEYETKREYIREQVARLCERYPIYQER